VPQPAGAGLMQVNARRPRRRDSSPASPRRGEPNTGWTVMIGISLENVCFIISLARAFDVKVDVVEPDPGSNPADEDMREVLEDYGDDPTFLELKTFIDSLNVDEQGSLVAIAWIGRGTFTKDEWDEALAEAQRARSVPTSDYLLGIPVLGDYLEEGLAELGYSCEDIER
jgi:Protein of unknown function (DUF3775)